MGLEIHTLRERPDLRPLIFAADLESARPEARGGGNSWALLGEMKACPKARGFAELFAPVRPNQKHLQPRTPMRDYVDKLRPDGLPIDAWLRTHVRIGGG